MNTIYIFTVLVTLYCIIYYNCGNQKERSDKASAFKKIGNFYKINMKIKNYKYIKYIDTRCNLSTLSTKIKNVNINDILNNSIYQNNDKTLVTVIIPVYNTQDTIIDSIASILNQTYKNIEIIIINDSSTDDSLNKIRSINDNRIIIYNNIENYGTYKSINIGLKMSTGNYILLHGSDDYVMTDCVEKLVTKLKKSNINMCYSNWLRGTILQKSPEGSFMFKRKILNSLGFFDNTRIAGDSEFIDRYKLKYNNELIYVNDILNMASVRGSSLTNSTRTKYSSNIRRNYVVSYKVYHNTINKTKNYYMPFLHNKKKYKEYSYTFKNNDDIKQPTKNIYLQNIGNIIK